MISSQEGFSITGSGHFEDTGNTSQVEFDSMGVHPFKKMRSI